MKQHVAARQDALALRHLRRVAAHPPAQAPPDHLQAAKPALLHQLPQAQAYLRQAVLQVVPLLKTPPAPHHPHHRVHQTLQERTWSGDPRQPLLTVQANRPHYQAPLCHLQAPHQAAALCPPPLPPPPPPPPPPLQHIHLLLQLPDCLSLRNKLPKAIPLHEIKTITFFFNNISFQ